MNRKLNRGGISSLQNGKLNYLMAHGIKKRYYLARKFHSQQVRAQKRAKHLIVKLIYRA